MKLYRILLLTLCAYTLISCGGAEERKAVYLEKAKASIASGDYDKARIELKNVLQIDPKDAKAYYQLGKVYEQQKEYRKAYGNYLKAEELNPEFLENKARLGRLYLILANDLNEAQKRVDFILSKDPVNPEGLLLKAAVLLKSNKSLEAVSIGEDILKRTPSNVDAISFVVVMYLKDKKTQEAISVLETALQSKPDNDLLNNLLAQVYINNKDYEHAEIIYKMLLEKYPDQILSYNRLAALYNTAGDKVKAEKLLRTSIDNKPDDADRYLTLVKYIAQIKGADEAISEMNASIVRNNSSGKLRIALAELLLLNRDKQGATDVYKKAIQDFPEELTGIEARTTLASLYFNDREFALANTMVEDTILISPNDPKINIIRARLALRDKNAEKAIIALRVVIKETPENIDAYFLLVNAYNLEKNEDQVASTLNTAYENNKTNPASLLKLTKYYLGHDPEKAEKIIDSYNSLKESDYEGMSIKAVILNTKKNMSEAYVLAEKLIELYGDKPNGYLQALPYLSEQGKLDEVVSILEKGYISTKDNRKILELLTRLQVSEKKFDIVEKRIKPEIEKSPDDMLLKILLAKVYLANGKSRDAETLLNDVIVKKPDLEEPYILLSHVYRNNNDTSMNKSILIKGKNNVTASYKIPLKLAALYEEASDYKAAINVYREMYETRADNMIVVNNLASLLSDYSDDKNDLELMKSLAEKLEKNGRPVFLDTIGWVSYKLGDYKNAVKILTQMVEEMPNVNVFNYHLGMAYKKAGDSVNAKLYLEKSLADKKPFKEKTLVEAELKDL